MGRGWKQALSARRYYASMTHQTRNPRRACDANGNEIPPPTVGAAMADVYKTVMACCEGEDCRHGAEVPLEGWSPEAAVPVLALRLRCSKCGGRRIQVMMNVSELYARAFGAGVKSSRRRVES